MVQILICIIFLTDNVSHETLTRQNRFDKVKKNKKSKDWKMSEESI